MVQTASALSTGQSLLITSSKTHITAGSQEVETFAFLKETPLYFQSPSFSYNQRLRLGFQIKPLYARYFALIKGLIEFHRRRDLKFTFDKTRKSFEADIPAAQLEGLDGFLDLILPITHP